MVRQRAEQQRTAITRGKIVDGAITVLARSGVAGLTHRAVAQEAGVSLAATTYHFGTKTDILDAASQALLEGYLAAFDRLDDRILTGAETGLARLDDLVARVVANDLGRDRLRSLAWCEIILHGARDPARRTVAQDWYGRLDQLWTRIGARLEPAMTPGQARQSVDMAVGLTFLLHPLALSPQAVAAVLSGQRDPGADMAASAAPLPPPAPPAAPARQRVIAATIGVLADKGVAGVTFRSVSERAELSRSGPAHHFASVARLIEAAQLALFHSAKARYRRALAGSGAEGAALTVEGLLDLTTAVFAQEALDHRGENAGYYSAWVSAAQQPALRPAVAAAQLDQHLAWTRRLAALDLPPGRVPRSALAVQALFIGMLIRALAAGADPETLAQVRPAFAGCLAGIRGQGPAEPPITGGPA